MADDLTLITGFPGFIGTRLVRALLARDPTVRILALVEPRMLARATEVASGLGSDRVEVLAGDITDRRLGLAPERYEQLLAEISRAYHLAAIYNLAVPLEIAQRVNVEGTGNIVELCAGAERLQRLNYVSTAYVAGSRHGVVYEHELALGQRFKNHYESTKFQAELWVREMRDRVPTTIYRPAIVVGDSRTGETQKFDGPYYMLRLISMMQRLNLPIPQVGRAGTPFNVVPVDFVVAALVAASQDPQAAGETLHLVDPDPISVRELTRRLAEAYGGRAPSFRLPAGLVQESLRVPAIQEAFANTPRESLIYLNHAVRFDTRRASEVLARNGVSCPRLPDYLPTVVGFFREHENDPSYAPQPVS